MGFTDKQVRALGRSVPASAIRTRMSSGKELTYIEGWYAVAQANRIFGLEGWDRETVEATCTQAREARGTVTAIYSAKDRITVRTGEGVVVREGHGTGEAQGNSPGEVHDRALKTAETDATKRALATFGRAFGLALYAGARRVVPRSSLAQKVDDARPGGEEARPAVPEAPPATAALPADRSSTEPTASAEEPKTNPVPAAVSRKLARTSVSHRVDKSVLAFPELNRIRDKEHLRYVAAQPCLLCSATPADAHHVRFAQPRAMSRKVGDDFTVPLCRKHHRDLHDSGNEAAWWHDMGIEPLEIARQLWDESSPKRTELSSDKPIQLNSHPNPEQAI
jgi:hypothetical protein